MRIFYQTPANDIAEAVASVSVVTLMGSVLLSVRMRVMRRKGSDSGSLKRDESELDIDGRHVKLTRLDKVLYPKSGTTKAEVIDYYIRVSSYILPHLKD